jgi:hypothetical protein
MKTEFDLLVSFRTPDGFKPCAQYFLGSDRDLAEWVFGQLKGRNDIDDKAILHLDLVETKGEVPLKVKTISCKLSELCANCQFVTRELFREHAIYLKTGA